MSTREGNLLLKILGMPEGGISGFLSALSKTSLITQIRKLKPGGVTHCSLRSLALK